MKATDCWRARPLPLVSSTKWHPERLDFVLITYLHEVVESSKPLQMSWGRPSTGSPRNEIQPTKAHATFPSKRSRSALQISYLIDRYRNHNFAARAPFSVQLTGSTQGTTRATGQVERRLFTLVTTTDRWTLVREKPSSSDITSDSIRSRHTSV